MTTVTGARPTVRRGALLGATSRVEISLFLRDPMSIVFALALPVVMLVVLGGVFGDVPDPEAFRGVGAMTYYVPAYVALVIASVGVVSLPTRLAGYREAGVLRRFRAASLPAWAVLSAQFAVLVLVSALASVLLVLVGVVVYDPVLPSGAGDWAGVLVAFAAGAIEFGGIGLLLGALLPTARAAQGAGVLLYFVLLMLGGAGPPPEVLSGGLDVVAKATPMRPLVLAIQDAWLGFGWNLGELLLVTAIGLVCAAVAVRVLRWE